jgi:hypothetical protein
VQHEHERRSARAVLPVEVDEVAIARGQALPPQRQVAAAEERTPERLQVPVPAPPGRPILDDFPCPSWMTTARLE